MCFCQVLQIPPIICTLWLLGDSKLLLGMSKCDLWCSGELPMTQWLLGNAVFHLCKKIWTFFVTMCQTFMSRVVIIRELSMNQLFCYYCLWSTQLHTHTPLSLTQKGSFFFFPSCASASMSSDLTALWPHLPSCPSCLLILFVSTKWAAPLRCVSH